MNEYLQAKLEEFDEVCINPKTGLIRESFSSREDLHHILTNIITESHRLGFLDGETSGYIRYLDEQDEKAEKK